MTKGSSPRSRPPREVVAADGRGHWLNPPAAWLSEDQVSNEKLLALYDHIWPEGAPHRLHVPS